MFIGDGMGPMQEEAGSLYKSGTVGTLSFEQFPVITFMTTFSADNAVTDSAASSTAMATGVKVNNGVISKRIPGDESELYTLLEYFKNRGLDTGLVTTSYMTDATPAAFASHEPSRLNSGNIAQDYFTQTKPNVLFGGGGNGISGELATGNGYNVVTDLEELLLLPLDTASISNISGQFGSTHLPYQFDGSGGLPSLSQMTLAAIGYLKQNNDGFFLMVEGGLIDKACHINDIQRMVFEVIEFDKTVEIAADWAAARDDTLIIVTADHETGGLSIVKNNGKGEFPDVSWTTTGHTDKDVNVFAQGVFSLEIETVRDNTDFFSIITGLYNQ